MCRKRNFNSLSRVHVFDETREIKKLQVVVVQRRIRNVHKKVRCCSLLILTYCFFAIFVADAVVVS